MRFTYSRNIHFADTDAAGVVYFARYFSLCHEAYEEALQAAGIELKQFFGDEGVVIPISHASSDFLRPLQCGDKVDVELSTELVKESEFALDYNIFLPGSPRKLAARVKSRHVCIDAATRRRTLLPGRLQEWVSVNADA